MSIKRKDGEVIQHDIDKQLKNLERPLDVFEIKDKLKSTYYIFCEKNKTNFQMLYSKERNDITLFENKNNDENTYIKNLTECLMNRGKVLTIEQFDAHSFEIWIRDNEENFHYMLFEADSIVLPY